MALTHRFSDVQGDAVLVGENFVTLAVSQVSIETTEQLERALAEPLEDTGFQRLKDDIGAPTLGNVTIT